MVRARSFGSIRKLPSGRYQARYWHLGKQISAEHTFVNKTDARRWLSTVEADLVCGDWVDPHAGKITFGEYADWWIEQRPVRPRTKQIYEDQLLHITPRFAHVSLRDIRPIDVRGWHGELSHGSLHQNTIAKIYRLFRTIMSTTVEDDMLRRKPGPHQRGISRADDRTPVADVGRRASAGGCDPSAVRVLGVDSGSVRLAVRRVGRALGRPRQPQPIRAARIASA